MSGKRLVASIIASVALSVIITGGLTFLVLPIVYPNMQQDEGIVLQSVYAEFDTEGIINYDNITYQKIPDTEVPITIQENSKISVTFHVMFFLVLGASYSGGCVYNISIVVNGYGNQSYSIVYYKDGTGTRIIPINFYVTYLTGSLSAGTYLVEVYWKSYININPDHALALNYVGGQFLENPRSLLLLELT
ncbi:MAG: hypothetical protein ACW96S_00905 [Promethearchaeota archaeon]|jgi:hypothetical protein